MSAAGPPARLLEVEDENLVMEMVDLTEPAVSPVLGPQMVRAMKRCVK